MKPRGNVADLLERQSSDLISRWLARVKAEEDIITVPLSDTERCAYLPEMIRDMVARLRDPLPLGTRALMSDAAYDHGCLRRKQGYTPFMIVEESRMLQVSLFETLRQNPEALDFEVLLRDVMMIADEADSQLAQAISSYVYEAGRDGAPIEA